MAGDFVMVQFATPRKPEVLRIASILGVEPSHAFGLCVIAWMWFDEQTEDGRAIGATESMLDAVVCRAGFSNALRETGWLQVRDGALVVPNFDRLMGESAKKRAKNTVRQQRNRQERPVTDLSRKKRDKSATKEEKRREEKSNTHTHTRDEENSKPFIHGREDGEVLKLPSHADTPRCREWLEKWQNARRDKNGHRTPLSMWEPEAMRCSHWSEEKWFQSLMFSASKGSLSLIDSDDDFSKRRRAPTPASVEHEDVPVSELRKRAER